MQRYFGTIEDAQHVWLQLVQSSQLPIEHDVAGLFGEDPVEAGAHHAGAPGIRIALVSLEVSIIPPDQTSLQIQRATVRIAERLQLVDKPLGVDPALRMIANSELARTIGNDHRVPEQTLVTYGTPERCFGGYLDRIRLDCKCVEAKCLEVPSPGVFISEALLWMISQRSNRCRRHVHARRGGRSVLRAKEPDHLGKEAGGHGDFLPVPDRAYSSVQGIPRAHNQQFRTRSGWSTPLQSMDLSRRQHLPARPDGRPQ